VHKVSAPHPFQPSPSPPRLARWAACSLCTRRTHPFRDLVPPLHSLTSARGWRSAFAVVQGWSAEKRTAGALVAALLAEGTLGRGTTEQQLRALTEIARAQADDLDRVDKQLQDALRRLAQFEAAPPSAAPADAPPDDPAPAASGDAASRRPPPPPAHRLLSTTADHFVGATEDAPPSPPSAARPGSPSSSGDGWRAAAVAGKQLRDSPTPRNSAPPSPRATREEPREQKERLAQAAVLAGKVAVEVTGEAALIAVVE
jgi:hypothetical protein